MTKIIPIDSKQLWNRKVLLAATIAISGIVQASEYASLADQLYDLASTNQIEIVGLEFAASKPPQRVMGKPSQQIKELLSKFNTMMVLSDKQTLERVTILGEKEEVPHGITVPTQSTGKNHSIDGIVTGINGQQVSVTLLIDTGSDYLVLPQSMMETLGIDTNTAQVRRLQTANGVTVARVAKIQSLQIGNEVINDIDAAFMADEQLGNAKLLGMNVLQRYRVTLDHKEQTVTLIKVE